MTISFPTRSVETAVETVVETLALFGRARLVRLSNGRHELRGGTRNDLTNAKEWVALFRHDVILWPSEDSPARGQSPH